MHSPKVAVSPPIHQPALRVFEFACLKVPATTQQTEWRILVQPGNRNLIDIAMAMGPDEINPDRRSHHVAWGHYGTAGRARNVAHAILALLYSREIADTLDWPFSQQVINCMAKTDRLTSDEVHQWVLKKI